MHHSIFMYGQGGSGFHAEAGAELKVNLRQDSGSRAAAAHKTAWLLSFRFHQSDRRFGMRAAANQCAGHLAGESGDP